MKPETWPFKTRPFTNCLVQILIAVGLVQVAALWPLPVACLVGAVIVFFGGRAIIRQLRAEWFPPKSGWVVTGADGTKPLAETDEGKLWQIVGIKNTCPDCGGEGFFEGPRGGMSENISCQNAACRSKFNITAFGGGHGTVDRIGREPITVLDSYPRGSFGKNLTDDQLAAAKAKIIADEAPSPEPLEPSEENPHG